MNVSLSQVLLAAKTNSLTQMGSFIEVKQYVEAQLTFKLGVKGWNALHTKLNLLAASVSEHRDCIGSTLENMPFNKGKRELSRMLGFTIKAKNQAALNHIIKVLLSFTPCSQFDPYERYEENKLRNFISSSRLEGITIPVPDEKVSLEALLAKHRR